MASLVWLLIPLMAAVISAIWAARANRQQSDPSSGDAAGVAGYAAFRSAMERSAPEQRSTGAQDRISAGISSDGPSPAAD